MENPIAVPTKTQTNKFLKGFMFVVLSLLIVAIIWFIIVNRSVNRKRIKELVSLEAKKYPLEKVSAVEKLLMQGVYEIESSPIKFKQAKQYSKASGVPLEQVLVDSSVAAAKYLGYIG